MAEVENVGENIYLGTYRWGRFTYLKEPSVYMLCVISLVTRVPMDQDTRHSLRVQDGCGERCFHLVSEPSS